MDLSTYYMTLYLTGAGIGLAVLAVIYFQDRRANGTRATDDSYKRLSQ
ncbi:MAG: hypothetical protein HYT87_20285 [Nitrospirae bacterium]|nr:hypothetical protein [Nitrospirota bacterium]